MYGCLKSRPLFPASLESNALEMRLTADMRGLRMT